MTENVLSFEAAHAIYDALVEYAGETEDDYSRDMFVSAQTSEYIREYRFMGALGFGGKFWRDDWQGKWFVNNYPENETRATKAIVEKTNEVLAELYKKFN